MAIDLPPVDESTKIPEAVRRAAANADAIHKQVYQTPDPTPAPPVGGDSDQTIKIAPESPPHGTVVTTESGVQKWVAPQKTDVPQPQPPASPAPPEPPAPPALMLTPRGQPPAPQPPAADDNDESWKHKFLSAQGRLEQSQRMLGATQEQLTQMGDELIRMQNLVTQQPQPPQPAAPAPTFTPEERAAYGDEFLAVAGRAALAAIKPELEKITEGQQRLLEENRRNGIKALHATLDSNVSNWREINRSQEFAAWLALPDFYSGAVRGDLLKQAFAAGDASRVVRFFQGFVADATSQVPVPPLPAAELHAPGQPVFNLAALAAPGPTKPATGTDPGPVDKPIYTSAQIRGFYSEVRRGLWANRPQEKAALEADLIAAGREGRVRG